MISEVTLAMVGAFGLKTLARTIHPYPAQAEALKRVAHTACEGPVLEVVVMHAMNPTSRRREWLEADGLGGFASGTVVGPRTRRYHALLLAAATPPTGRFVLVNGAEFCAIDERGEHPLSTERYAPGVDHPGGADDRVERFDAEPWPRWTHRLGDSGTCLQKEIVVAHGRPLVVVRWRRLAGSGALRLRARPFLSGRDYHALQHANGAFDFSPRRDGDWLRWRPYEGVPGIALLANAEYHHEPDWYRSFLYDEEVERGLDALEDLAAPGSFTWSLERGDAIWVLAADPALVNAATRDAGALELAREVIAAELARRARFRGRLERAADAYLVERRTAEGVRGKTIVAGYPWFTDWGRDTFIALRGLCLAAGRLDDARAILLAWATSVSEGMLPNRFPDRGEEPEYNSVDASLWFVVAVGELFAAAEGRLDSDERQTLERAVDAVLAGYSRGTRYGIRLDEDGLLAAGTAGVQLTWMDAKAGDWVVTPRAGKPVEVEALWLNALWAAGHWTARWKAVFQRGLSAFRDRFWNAARQSLHDVVDVDHCPGITDARVRPNQILAVGGLPLCLLDEVRARRVVDTVEARLLTPLGLRSLDPDDHDYRGRYTGGVLERDGAYHQGTVWPWLAGPFAEAWLRVREDTRPAREEARARFLVPLIEHLDAAGIGHVSEIADGDAPHTPRGCPFQAWSVAEALRLERTLAEGGRRQDDPGGE